MRIILALVLLAACGSVSSDGDDGGGGGGGACMYKDPGTHFASCSDDSDCYSGWCKLDGNPGPYCFVPTHAARNALHGYSCTSNADCDEVLDAEAIASGIYGTCFRDQLYDGCAFYCGGGGTGSGSGSGSGV